MQNEIIIQEENHAFDGVEIIAETEEEAEAVMDALMLIHENLDNAEVIAMAQFIVEKPDIIPFIRRTVENPPKWVFWVKRFLPKSWFEEKVEEVEEAEEE